MVLLDLGSFILKIAKIARTQVYLKSKLKQFKLHDHKSELLLNCYMKFHRKLYHDIFSLICKLIEINRFLLLAYDIVFLSLLPKTKLVMFGYILCEGQHDASKINN